MLRIFINKSRRSKGLSSSRESSVAFTLIELCVGLVVGGMVCIGMMTLMQFGSKLDSKTQKHLESLQTAQICAEIIREDLQNMVIGPVSAGPGASTSGSSVFNVTPFKPMKTGGNADPNKPLVEVPDPIDLSAGGEFTFFRTIDDEDLSDNERGPTFPELSNLTAGSMDLSANFTPERAFQLVAITYKLKERKYKKWTYYNFQRIVRDGDGNVIKKGSKVYRNLRLKNLIFAFQARDWDNIGGNSSFTPPAPPSAWASAFQQLANGNVLAAAGQMIAAAFGLGGNNNQPQQQSGPPKPPRDFAYFVQFIVTGLSSKPKMADLRGKKDTDFQENTLIGVISFDALAEKLRSENGAIYWNSHLSADGYMTTGTFDFIDQTK